MQQSFIEPILKFFVSHLAQIIILIDHILQGLQFFHHGRIDCGAFPGGYLPGKIGM